MNKSVLYASILFIFAFSAGLIWNRSVSTVDAGSCKSTNASCDHDNDCCSDDCHNGHCRAVATATPVRTATPTATPVRTATPTATPVRTATPTATTSPAKVYVCKYVGTPGVNESLQTGQNPIEVSVNALPNGWSVGSFFNDQQGRSFVLATVPQTPEPNINNCPSVSVSPTPTATPVRTATPTATAFATATPTLTPTATPTQGPCEECEPTATPTVTATALPTVTPTPNGDVCPNLEGIQLSLPDEYHFDNDGINCLKFELGGPNPSTDSGIGGSQVLGTSTTGSGKVLGATTLAKTGAFEDSLFNSIFTLGSLLTSFGIMRKSGKK